MPQKKSKAAKAEEAKQRKAKAQEQKLADARALVKAADEEASKAAAAKVSSKPGDVDEKKFEPPAECKNPSFLRR
eukprot:gene13739-21313_t